ncbi:hypothetical protein [Aquimarina sediminis]|uniref:hypothetical protein n=1 Tax=Aquimarina sediminis TaxID=2070536 RepID=UPI000CA0061D|nr:hypothetical protein [Aquimarina sediminis]
MTKEIYIKEIRSKIEQEKLKIRKTFSFDDSRIAMLELTRSIDSAFVYIYFLLPREDKEYENAYIVFSYISAGFYNSLKTFIDKSINKSGYPLFVSDSNGVKWANDTNIRFGHIGYIEKYIELANQQLFSINKINANDYKFTNLFPSPNREQLVVEDFNWWQNQISFSEKDLTRLKYLKPIVEKQVFEKVSIWKEHFIRYDSTSELDEHYEIVGRLFRRRMTGSDSFPLDAKFGLLSFGEIIMIIEAIIGYSLKHKDHCLALLRKTNYTINPWNLYPLDERIDDLAYSISIHKKLDYKKVFSFLVKLSIDEKDVDKLGDSAGNAPPPLIRISKEFILKSLAGILNNPFAYLTRSLKFNYERDYFNAVNHREKVFKDDLYKLLDAKNLISISRNINLKLNGKLITDIDALIYDINSKTILLVQLKWLDDFGASMKMRYSMSKNFYSSSIKWIDKVESWLKEREIFELIKNDIKGINQNDIKNIELLILGRNFSHFSDQKEDNRASWCSWYTLIKLVTENSNYKKDIKLLTRKIKENNLKYDKNLSKEEIDSIEDEILQVQKSKISIGF